MNEIIFKKPPCLYQRKEFKTLEEIRMEPDIPQNRFWLNFVELIGFIKEQFIF